jgi:hypothetical protein
LSASSKEKRGDDEPSRGTLPFQSSGQRLPLALTLRRERRTLRGMVEISAWRGREGTV